LGVEYNSLGAGGCSTIAYCLLPIPSWLLPLAYSLLPLYGLCLFLYLPRSINEKCPMKGHYILEAEREGLNLKTPMYRNALTINHL